MTVTRRSFLNLMGILVEKSRDFPVCSKSRSEKKFQMSEWRGALYLGGQISLKIESTPKMNFGSSFRVLIIFVFWSSLRIGILKSGIQMSYPP